MSWRLIKILFIATFLLPFAAWWLTIAWLYFAAAILFIIAACFFIIGIFHLNSQTFLSVYNTNKKRIYLSFDDGPEPELTPLILDVLKKHNIKGLFFLIGRKAEQHPEIVKRIAAEGHIIGNHSYSHHIKWTFSSARKARENVALAQKTIREAAHQEPVFFRPPFGVTNPHIAKAVRSFHLKTVGWHIRSFDTKADSAERLLYSVKKKIYKKRGCLLLHDTSPFIGSFLEQLIDFCNHNEVPITSITDDPNFSPAK